MSIATRALHEHATLLLNEPNPAGGPKTEITFTLESPSWDELSRLWQALTVPLRMTAVYRAGVVMLKQETGAVAHPPYRQIRLGAVSYKTTDTTETQLY